MTTKPPPLPPPTPFGIFGFLMILMLSLVVTGVVLTLLYLLKGTSLSYYYEIIWERGILSLIILFMGISGFITVVWSANRGLHGMRHLVGTLIYLLLLIGEGIQFQFPKQALAWERGFRLTCRPLFA